MASSAAKITKFQSFTLTEKISTRDILPDWEADKIIDTTKVKIKTVRSNVFNELTMNCRLVSFTGTISRSARKLQSLADRNQP
jgi:hypothetical protein